VTPTDALRLLMRTGQPADDAAEALTLAMRGPAFRLWCNGNLVAIDIKLTVAVKAHYVDEPKDKAGWIATIVNIARAWEHPPDYYRWEFDEREVAALLPPPSAADRPRRIGSREQRMIRRMVDKKLPGWRDMSTSQIMKDIGDKLKDKGIPVPGRDTFERALGRRKG
jgi:hypothetical protein